MVVACVVLVLITLALAVLTPAAWYWRVGTFLIGLLVIRVVYPGFRAAVRGRV